MVRPNEPLTKSDDVVWLRNKLIKKEEEVDALLHVVDNLLDMLVSEKMKNRMRND